MKNIIKAFKSGKNIVIKDFSDFVAEQSRTGGRYWYATKYKLIGTEVEIEYSTSAVFEYCEKCGDFSCRGECEIQKISFDVFVEHVESALQLEDFHISIED